MSKRIAFSDIETIRPAHQETENPVYKRDDESRPADERRAAHPVSDEKTTPQDDATAKNREQEMEAAYQDKIRLLEARVNELEGKLSEQANAHEASLKEYRLEVEKQAREDAEKALSEQVAEQREQLAQLHVAVVEAVRQGFSSVTASSADVAAACLKKLVGEHFHDEAFRMALIKNVVDGFVANHVISIEVSPVDFAMIQSDPDFADSEAITWVSSPTLKAGDCIVNMETEMLDASLKKQTESLLDILEGSKHA